MVSVLSAPNVAIEEALCRKVYNHRWSTWGRWWSNDIEQWRHDSWRWSTWERRLENDDDWCLTKKKMIRWKKEVESWQPMSALDKTVTEDNQMTGGLESCGSRWPVQMGKMLIANGMFHGIMWFIDCALLAELLAVDMPHNNKRITDEIPWLLIIVFLSDRY